MQADLGQADRHTQSPAGTASIWTALRMALPLIATSFVFCLIGIVDMKIAGWQGAAAQAAVGVADQVIFVTVLLGTGLAAATGCFVSQSIGARNLAAAARFAQDGLWMAAIFGALSSILCYFAADAVLHFTGATPAVFTLGMPYLQMCAFGNLPFMVVLVQAAILRATGRTCDCLRIWSLIGLVSIGGALPLYMVSGSPTFKLLTSLALAWDLGALVGMIYGVWLLAGFFADARFLPEVSFGRNERVRALAKVAVPVLMSEGCYIVSLFSMYAILGGMPESETMQAAYSVVLKIEETFAILPLVALSAASATLVGQNIGAGSLARARKLGWQLAFLGTAILLFGGCLLQFTGADLAMLFTEDRALVALVSQGTAGAAVSLPLIAFAYILFAAMEGAGQAGMPFWAQFAGYIVVRIPLAFFLGVTFHMGFAGVWLAIFLSRIIMAAIAATIYQRSDLSSSAMC